MAAVLTARPGRSIQSATAAKASWINFGRTIPAFPWAITIPGNGGSFRSAATPVRSPNFPAGTSRHMPSCSGKASRWISALAIAGARMNRTFCCRCGCLRMVQGALTPRHRPNPRRPNHRVLERRVHRPQLGRPEVSSGFRAKALSSEVDSPRRKRLKHIPHQRTLWLGTTKAVVPGGSEPPPKNLQAARIRMSRARIAIRSSCLGS